MAGATTVAFEPAAATAQEFLRNITINGLADLVSLKRCAVGSAIGEVQFTTELDTTNHVDSGANSSSESVKVAVDTLDSVFADQIPLVMKMDIEGYEAEALRGGRTLLQSTGLAAVVIEVNGQGERYGSSDESVRRILELAGFRRCNYEPFSRRLEAWREIDSPLATSGNEIYVRDMELIRTRVTTAASIPVLDQMV